MEPARSTDDFTRRMTVADSNNIVVILDMNAVNSEYQIFEEDYLTRFQVALEDLKVTVGLGGLAEASWPEINPLMSEAEKMAEIARVRTSGQKISLQLYTAKGNGPWTYQSKVVLQNHGNEETHVPILVPFLSSNETLLVGGDFKLGARIEPIWNQPLKANDYLVIKGTYKQVVSFSKKKDDDLERLGARIEALELALEGRLTNLRTNTLLGRNAATPGVVEVIPQEQFVETSGNQTIAGNKTFSSSITCNGGLISTNVNGRAVMDHNGVSALRLQAWGPSSVAYGQYVFNQYYSDGAGGRNALVCNQDSTWNIGAPTNTNANLHTFFGSTRITGFATLGDNVSVKMKRVTGVTASTVGATAVVPHGLVGDKIVWFGCKIIHTLNSGISDAFDTAVAGYGLDCYHDATNFLVVVSGANAISKPFSIIFFYIA